MGFGALRISDRGGVGIGHAGEQLEPGCAERTENRPFQRAPA